MRRRLEWLARCGGDNCMDILGWHGLGASEMALPVDISIVVEGMWWHTGAMSAMVPWWQLLGGGSGDR